MNDNRASMVKTVILYRMQKIKFLVKLFSKSLREFESRALKVFYACKRVFEVVWRNFSQVKKVPPETPDFRYVFLKESMELCAKLAFHCRVLK